MRVGFLFSHPLSESLGSVRRVLGLATGLRDRGVEPVILTPFSKAFVLNGVKIESVPNIFLKLGLDNFAYRVTRSIAYNRYFCKFIIRNMNRSEIDKAIIETLERLKINILQIEQEPTAVSILSMLKRLSIPLILDFHGIWAEELVDIGMLARKSREYRMLQDMVKNAASSMDGILVMSEEMRRYILREYGASPEKIHIIEFGANARIKELPERGGLPKVIYAGMLSKEKHVDLFLRSIPYVIKKKSANFYVTGKGDTLRDAYKIKKNFKANIRSFWFQNEDDLLNLMSTCNVGVLTLPNNLSYRINPAAKFFDYMSVGLPVVANDIDGWTEIIKREGVGILTKDNPEDFANGILSLIENPDLALKCGMRCLKLLNSRYDPDIVSEKLLNLYAKLLE